VPVDVKDVEVDLVTRDQVGIGKAAKAFALDPLVPPPRFGLKDDTLDEPDLLPPPDEIAAEIVENLEAALDRFRKVALSLQAG
jgi:hypothetical protein